MLLRSLRSLHRARPALSARWLSSEVNYEGPGTCRDEVLNKSTLLNYEQEEAVLAEERSGTTRLPYHLRKGLKVTTTGLDLLHDPLFNKGTGFNMGERDRLGLRGLLPPVPSSLEDQIKRVMASVRAQPNDLAKALYISDLHDRNETLFHLALVRHIAELAPIVYVDRPSRPPLPPRRRRSSSSFVVVVFFV